MFDLNAYILKVNEETGVMTAIRAIPVSELAEKLLPLAEECEATKIHFFGQDYYVRGLADIVKKSNLKFSHYEIEVN